MIRLFKWMVLLVPLLLGIVPVANANDLSQIDRSFIMRQEGLILYPYNDIANYKTICYGHLVTRFDHIKSQYSVEECLSIFEKDLTLMVIQNNECLGVDQNNNQFTAIIDFQFNLGTTNACKSSLFNDIRLNESNDIKVNDFLKWKYVRINGKLTVNQSILNRRIREANLYSGKGG